MTFDELVRVGTPGLALLILLVLTGVVHVARECDRYTAELLRQLGELRQENEQLRAQALRAARTARGAVAMLREGE